MKKLLLLFLTAMLISVSSCSQKELKNFAFVEGGSFINTKSNYYGKGVSITDFYIGKKEVSQKEWIEVMGNNPSEFKDDNLPVETVSWYDCIEYCNKRSINENLKPYYNIAKNRKDPENNIVNDNIKWAVTINRGANGYRLPTEAEWEYAASGGQLSLNYKYSGSDDLDKVGWYWRNSGDENLTGSWLWPALEKNHCKTKPIGSKISNELGLYDMSGNVREWCWDWLRTETEIKGRIWKGGGWIGADFCCESSFRGDHEANGKGPDQGFRLCRSK